MISHWLDFGQGRLRRGEDRMGVYGEDAGCGDCPAEKGWPMTEERNESNCNDVNRYENLVSVGYKTDKPFARTFIVEEDSMLGRREICLYNTINKINSEVCTSL